MHFRHRPHPPSRKRTTRGRRVTRPPLSDFRALTLFESLNPEHKTFRVRDAASAPHLKEGEYAVVDVGDRDLQHGELYLIQYESGERRREIVQAHQAQLNITGPGAARSLVWWVGDLRGYQQTGEVMFGNVPVFAGLSDGPYRTEHLQSKLIGRVVGVALSPLGGLLAPAAGYENEEAANAAFDPVEYVDVLLATGHRPAVCCDENGEPRWYYEEMPRRRRTKAQEAADLAVRRKYRAASNALERVKAECIRRGLVDAR